MGRRLTRLALALGIVLLLLAPILRLAVTPLLAQAPRVPGAQGFLNSISTGTVSTLFDLETGTSSDPILVTRSQTTRGDLQAGLDVVPDGLNVGVYSTLDRVVTDSGTLVSDISYRLAADRHTQALADCCGANVAGVSTAMAGAGNPLRLPWFVPAAPYPYYDVTLMAPVEMEYLGTDRVGDIDAVKLQQATPPTPVGTIPVPGRLVGSEDETVGVQRTYAATRTLWVDPTTGIILRQTERIREALRTAEGRDIVTLLAMNLTSTQEQVDAQVAAAHREGRPVLWAHAYGPALCLVLGGLLVLLGLGRMISLSRTRRAQEDFPDDLTRFEDLRSFLDDAREPSPGPGPEPGTPR